MATKLETEAAKLAGKTLYEEDYHAWTQTQAAALRRMLQRKIGTALDPAHLAEEVEDLGHKRARRRAQPGAADHRASLAAGAFTGFRAA